MAYPVPSPHSFFVIRKDQEIKGIVKNANNVIHENKLSILNKKDELELADTQKLIHLFLKIVSNAKIIRNYLYKEILEVNIFTNGLYLRLIQVYLRATHSLILYVVWSFVHTIAIWIPLTKCFFESLLFRIL